MGRNSSELFVTMASSCLNDSIEECLCGELRTSPTGKGMSVASTDCSGLRARASPSMVEATL